MKHRLTLKQWRGRVPLCSPLRSQRLESLLAPSANQSFFFQQSNGAGWITSSLMVFLEHATVFVMNMDPQLLTKKNPLQHTFVISDQSQASLKRGAV